MDNGSSANPNIGEVLINGHETMALMDELGVPHAIRAVVPIRAVEALVANTKNVLVAAITDSSVHQVAARVHLGRDALREDGALDSWGKAVLGVVAMVLLGKARLAEVKVLASSAMEELSLGEFLHAAVAGAHVAQSSPSRRKVLVGRLREHVKVHSLGLGRGSLINVLFIVLGFFEDKLRVLLNNSLLGLLLNESWLLDRRSRDLGRKDPGGKGVSGALDEPTLDNVALDQPVRAVVAGDSLTNTQQAEVEITVIAG